MHAVTTVFALVSYILFAALAAHGMRVAGRLQHGEEFYRKHYKAEIQKRIDKLKEKFPQLKDWMGLESIIQER